MEGPSLVILHEELERFRGHRVRKVSGNSKQPIKALKGLTLERIETWGKVLFLFFAKNTKAEPLIVRVHFLMFGSYRIDDPKENRFPRLELEIGDGILYFYSCALRFVERPEYEALDKEVDLLSSKWSEKRVLELMEKRKNDYLCDLMLDQNVFTGSGNIVKNEVLFNLRRHPLTKLSAVPREDWPALAWAVRHYCFMFYVWKKKFELRKHWQVYKRHKCPLCGEKLARGKLGKLTRSTFYCEQHQPLRERVRHLDVYRVLPLGYARGGKDAPAHVERAH